MSKLLNRSLKNIIIYAGLVLIGSIPVYFFIISKLWQYELDEHNIVLTAEADREDTFLIILILTSLTVLFFVLLIVGLLLLNRSISKRLWQPFYRSLGQIRHFDLNQQGTVVFEETDIDEFHELNQSLTKLIAGNVAAYSQQKEFADNASHELQTPLAIIQSKLELLLQSKSLTNDQYDLIEEANRALTRVTRINKNLLLLTKIENSQFGDKKTIDLSELMHRTTSLFTNFWEDKRLTVKTVIQPGVLVEGNTILVEILLNNLLTNAIRYSDPDSTITVGLAANSLCITNSGTEPLKQEHLFKRFSSTSSQTPGTGLGLALVKQICNRYHWEIDYHFDDRRHIFTVHF